MPFTAKDVLDTVVRIGQENPDFVYTDQEGYKISSGCGYVGNGVGSEAGSPCIVGKALMELGVSQDYLLYEQRSAYPLLYNLSSDKGDDTTSLYRLEAIQQFQDQGLSWGEAVAQYVNKKEES